MSAQGQAIAKPIDAAVEPADGPAYRRKLVDRPLVMLGGQVAVIVVILGVWEIASRMKWVDPFFFSKPSDIWAYLIQLVQSKNFLVHLRTTMMEASIGLVIGCGA